jgi:Na+/H+ antiporter NhaD/arsenite permease-like protein
VPLLMTDKILYLEAISAGAVFFGACSYIGNAPNFMVRSIAEEAGTTMPSFFGYILKFSLVFLIPSFVVVTLIFF